MHGDWDWEAKKLLEAAKEGDETNVIKLIHEGAHINNSCLLVSADGGHDKVVKIFLDQGVNVNWDQPGQMTALMRAAISGHFSTTKLLLDHVAKINLQDSYAGSTALMFSAERKYPDIVSLLLFAGANKNLRKKTGETAFELAEKNGSNDVIKIFSVYQNHCKIQGEDLYIAAQEGNARLVRGLLIAWANLDYRDANNDQAIHMAAEKGHNAVISVLLEYGADINSIGQNNYTPLLWAARSVQFSTVRFLLDNGANMNLKTTGGNTALMWATKRNDLKTACELLDRGASKFIRSSVFSRLTDTMAILLTQGKLLPIDKNVAKVLLTATENGNVKVVDSLIRRGASIEVSNNIGETPFQIAIRLPQRKKQEYTQQLEAYNRSGVKLKEETIRTGIEMSSKKGNKLAKLFLAQKLSHHGPATISRRVSDIVDYVKAFKKYSLYSLGEQKFHLKFSTNDEAKETLLESIVSHGLLKEREEVLEILEMIDELLENGSDDAEHRIKEEVKAAVSSSEGLRKCLKSVEEKYPWSKSKTFVQKFLSFFTLFVIGSCFYGFDVYTDIRFSQDMFEQSRRNFSMERELCKGNFDDMIDITLDRCKNNFTEAMCMKSLRLVQRMGEDCFENEQRFSDTKDWEIAGNISYLHCGLPILFSFIMWEIIQIGQECGVFSVFNFPLPFITRFHKFLCDRELFENYSWPQRNDDSSTKDKYEYRKKRILKKAAAIEHIVNLSLIIEASVESSFQFFFQTVFALPNIVLTFTDPDGSLVWTDLFNWKTFSILLSFMSFAWAFYTIRLVFLCPCRHSKLLPSLYNSSLFINISS